MARPSEEVIGEIRQLLLDAPHGQKAATAAALGERFGVSQGTIYGWAGLQTFARSSQPRKPEYLPWVEAIYAHANSHRLSLKVAFRSLLASGALPPEAAGMHINTAYALGRRHRLRPALRRTQRLHADYPLQAVQFDGSTSASLIAQEPLPDGDWVLKVHRRQTPATGYKNKPLSAGRQRVVCYGIWDMATGLTRTTYTVSAGENSLDAITALVAMLSDGADPLRPMAGVPCHLWTDQGALFKARSTRDLIGRLDIALVTGEAYAKERQGGIERNWRELWRSFEAGIRAETGRQTILLSEVQARLANWEREQGAGHCRQPVSGRTVSKADAWQLLAVKRPAGRPLRKFPDNPLSTLYREEERKIDRNGIIRFDGTEYECHDWHLRKVIVRQALDGTETLTLEDPRTGERSTATPYQARAYGQVRPQRKTPLDRAMETHAGIEGGALYTDDETAAPAGAGGGNVVALRARLREAADLDNPLDAARFSSMAEAMQAFRSIYHLPLGPEDLAAVERQIADLGLDRHEVIELASDLLADIQLTHGEMQ